MGQDHGAYLTDPRAIDLLERIAKAVEQLVRARPRQHRDRKLHPKVFVARTLGIHKRRLAEHIAAGDVRTVRRGKWDAITDQELQRLLEEGLPELAARRPGPRRRAHSPRPQSAPSEKPGAAIRALRVT